MAVTIPIYAPKITSLGKCARIIILLMPTIIANSKNNIKCLGYIIESATQIEKIVCECPDGNEFIAMSKLSGENPYRSSENK
tara:strand:- start:440 stop:685 length:246 start_codon:yes stop_codon:yes gene_type:complete